MGETFLRKIINKDFGVLTVDEVKVIITQDNVFSINKKDKKVLEKFVEENSFETNYGIQAVNLCEMDVAFSKELVTPTYTL